MITIYLSTEKWNPESAIIRYGTRYQFSHAGFYDSVRDTYLSAQLKGGVQERYVHGHPWPERFDEIAHFTAPGIEAAHEYALTQIGAPYDWRAILGIASDKDWHCGEDYFCSELVAYAFEATMNPLLNPNTIVWRITPRDLTLSPLLAKVKP